MLVVNVVYSYATRGWPPVVIHGVEVREVIKGFRHDRKVYYVPLLCGEDAKKEVPQLLTAGKSYIVAVRLLGFPFTCGFVKAAVEINDGPSEASFVAAIRTEAGKYGAFGSSDALEECLEKAEDTVGIRSARSDGTVDPEAFGLSKDNVRAYVTDGLDILVVRYRKSETPEGENWICDVIEQLEGRAARVGSALWVKDDGKQPQPKAPYVRAARTPERTYVVVVKPSDDLPQVIVRVPLINPNDRCASLVRDWCREVKSASRPSTRPK